LQGHVADANNQQPLSFSTWPLWVILSLFLFSAALIAVAGVHITRLADRLADITGLGEALLGAVLLGGTTSLPGIVASVSTAYQGYPELSVSNAIGGITAQTAFLVLADIAYRRANLEHAAASLENLMQGTLLAILLAMPVAAMSGPDVAFWGVHPVSPLLIAVYLFGLRLVSQARSAPLWHPHTTGETRLDEADVGARSVDGQRLRRLWVRFGVLAAIIAAAGYTIAQTGIAIVARTGLSETIVGALFTAIATSLPELVIVMAAVKQGALTLAVSNIIGGNSFDVLFLAFSDIAYREGSLYHAIANRQLFLIGMALVMTGTLLLGLLRREKSGIANIGFESFAVLLLYMVTVAMVFSG
jgi:cation:H+ antiporter